MSNIHRTAVVSGDVTIGEGTTIGAFCYLQGPLLIGKNNRINPHCIIGTEPESRDAAPKGRVIIGDNNVLSELTVIQRGTGDRETTIGNNNFLMDSSHIGHDCLLQNDITIAPNVVLAGHVVIQSGATVGIGAAIHQFSTIGGYSMIGMNSAITRDVPPFSLVVGNPAEFIMYNSHQLKKLGIQKLGRGSPLHQNKNRV